MERLTLGWEYLTGYSVATDPASRERPEWPPHPGRVFLALAAAWFETGEDAEEGEALRWLETLGAPKLSLPPYVTERARVTAYVPVNDKAGPSAAALQSAPALTRKKQARSYPSSYVGEAPCFLTWGPAAGADEHRGALDRLALRVTRIGHSSSLVRMWVAGSGESTSTSEETCSERDCWVPTDIGATAHCRVVTPGTLDALPEQTQIRRIEAFGALAARIDDAVQLASRAKQAGEKEVAKAARSELKAAKRDYEVAFGEPWRKQSKAPPLLRPRLGIWAGYRRVSEASSSDVGATASHFDSDLLVLTRISGPRLGLESTLVLTRALRGTIMVESGLQPAPSWITGHDSEGAPLQDDAGHLASIALPFIDHAHADGSLLGLGLAFPRSVAREERGRALGPLLVDEHGEPRQVELRLGRLGVWTLQKADWRERRRALQSETWTGLPHGSVDWASVTPVVLDRFPKARRGQPDERAAWDSEVCGIIAKSCQRIGLPEPEHMEIGTTPWSKGSPRAVGKRRALRGKGLADADAAFGDGFPFYPARGTNAPRPQVHARLRFAEPVLGPVLLGAGRHLGYGLCFPMRCLETRGE